MRISKVFLVIIISTSGSGKIAGVVEVVVVAVVVVIGLVAVVVVVKS